MQLKDREPPGPSGPPIGEERREPGQKSAFDFADSPASDESIPQLLRRLVDQGGHLAQQQTALLESELRSGIGDLKEAAGAMAGAAVVGVAGLGVLLMGLSFLLGLVMPLWLATMIVAVATLAVAYTMYAAGKRKIQSSSLEVERTRRTLERAPDAMTGHPHPGETDGRR